MRKRTKLIVLMGAALLVLFAFFVLFTTLLQDRLFPPPDPRVRQPYDYYLIIDKSDGTLLMYVSIEVNVGDELLTADNKVFRVVRVRGNVAEAEFTGFRFESRK